MPVAVAHEKRAADATVGAATRLRDYATSLSRGGFTESANDRTAGLETLIVGSTLMGDLSFALAARVSRWAGWSGRRWNAIPPLASSSLSSSISQSAVAPAVGAGAKRRSLCTAAVRGGELATARGDAQKHARKNK
jgi:hypothetical protein